MVGKGEASDKQCVHNSFLETELESVHSKYPRSHPRWDREPNRDIQQNSRDIEKLYFKTQKS